MTALSPAVLRRIPLRFLLPVLVLGVLLGSLWGRERETDRREHRRRMLDVVRLQVRILESQLDAAAAAVTFLGGAGPLSAFLTDPGRRAGAEAEVARFLGDMRAYDRVRLVQPDGRELLRVDDGEEGPRALEPSGRLVEEHALDVYRAWPLAPGDLYFSRFELDGEGGRVEEPWRPVVHLATPVLDAGGEKAGVLVATYRGNSLFERLAKAAASIAGWCTLVDGRGYFLRGPTPGESWGFQFGRPPTFAARHAGAWDLMRRHEVGNFIDEDGLFAFTRIFGGDQGAPPNASLRDLELRVVAFVPAEQLYAGSRRLVERMGAGLVVASGILLLVAWRLSYVAAVRDAHARSLEASQRRLRQLSARLLAAQEEERRRISRDLHDELGQYATAARIGLQHAGQVEGVEERRRSLANAAEAMDALLRSMHRMTRRIRSTALDDLGLDAALRTLVDEATSEELAVACELDLEAERLPRDVADNAYRIVQEALTNVQRHSGAHHASVTVREREDEGGELLLELVVEDDGRGFSLGDVGDDRLGLLGIRERAALLGGRASLDSRPGEGTRLRVLLPIVRDDGEEPS